MRVSTVACRSRSTAGANGCSMRRAEIEARLDFSDEGDVGETLPIT